MTSENVERRSEEQLGVRPQRTKKRSLVPVVRTSTTQSTSFSFLTKNPSKTHCVYTPPRATNDHEDRWEVRIPTNPPDLFNKWLLTAFFPKRRKPSSAHVFYERDES